MIDVLIVGGGVIGCMIARELSRYQLNITLLEKTDDLSMGASKANSAIVHAGYDASPGSLKAITNIKGNKVYEAVCKELGVPFKRIGALLYCFDKKDISKLEELVERGNENGVEGLEVLFREEILRLEPNVGDNVVAALHAPTSGITCPYEMTFALGENASENGVVFFRNQEVVNVSKENEIFVVKTQNKTYKTKILINAAGVHADEINNMISNDKIIIIPRAGEYVVMDKIAGNYVNHTIFQLPTDKGKGILVTPSVDGNLLIGPTANDIENKEDSSTTTQGREQILASASKSIGEVPVKHIITGFTGIRAHSTKNDFIIEHVPDVKNMINVAGIESPGLTAAPAIGDMVVELVGALIRLDKNDNFNPIRKSIVRFREEDNETQKALLKENALYGNIVCRCENVTEAEIVECINRPVGARNLDAVKRRVRAGMGRCQGGFCAPIVTKILARELGKDITEITKSGGDSYIMTGKNRAMGGKS